jgi:UDP-N-acetylmuramate dehydrogenase
MSAQDAAFPVDLKPLHTFGLSAACRANRTLNHESDFMAYADAVEAGECPLLMGEGSNTVFTSTQIDRTRWTLGLKGRQYLGCKDGFHLFRVQAGENWHQWVEWSVVNGFGGLENLALIPGSVGASPVQNIGAYGVELVDRIHAVQVFDIQARQFKTLGRDECQFAYRDSVFKRERPQRHIIVAVDFALPVRWEPLLSYGDVQARVAQLGAVSALNVMKTICAIRTEKLPDPAVLGNSGSFFKNPVVSKQFAHDLRVKHPGLVSFPFGDECEKLAAGWLIDQSGLKGYVQSGVGVYAKQALILVNVGEGTGADLSSLIAHIQNTVARKFDVMLEPEPNLIGDL